MNINAILVTITIVASVIPFVLMFISTSRAPMIASMIWLLIFIITVILIKFTGRSRLLLLLTPIGLLPILLPLAMWIMMQFTGYAP